MFGLATTTRLLHTHGLARTSQLAPWVLRTCPLKRPASRLAQSAFTRAPFVHPTANGSHMRGMRGLAGAAVLASIGLTAFHKPVAHCETSDSGPAPSGNLDAMPPPPQSSVRLYELSFGTICGVCAGVFVKKGAKALAFVFGGLFVTLQYFVSLRLVRVDWAYMESKFTQFFYERQPRRTGQGEGPSRLPTVYALWRWLVDFLTADFQPRASFLAGLALGLRIG
ncbi:hypothetical protein M0805_006058 [Coniferiporia weirii]|nr:hypothetical protein M0805_006058 [Coniferiporia weirii]